MKNKTAITQLRVEKREKNKASIMTLIQRLHCQEQQMIDSRDLRERKNSKRLHCQEKQINDSWKSKKRSNGKISTT